MNMPSAAPQLDMHKHFTSSILLWMRTDQPRQTGMDYWKGPHSGIISATPGLEEYRQIHLAEHNPGRWPTTTGVQTSIPTDRKIDGIAEVTFRSALAPTQGRKQTNLAHQDEINVFHRTLLYAGPPNSSRWYHVAGPDEKVGARALVYLRRRDEAAAGDLRKLIKKQLAPALAGTGALKELRTQTFLPWIEKLWDTPNVAHDNPHDQHFHASLILGFTDTKARDTFFTSNTIHDLSNQLTPLVSAIHAYDVTATLTYVKNGNILPHHQE
ncbi:strictosidine synthase [Streptomyces sp. 2A115]|uniref:strictosidine synthase n=1 Tax=Streptomyces sp. 2A115 TaxID=3457439 RepID=UPI003FD29442